MDISVTQGLLHPDSDSVMLAPQPPFFLGPLTSQHCTQFSQHHLQYNIEQRQREMEEEEKREELQQLIRKRKSGPSAVASPMVRQKLREHLIMKSQSTHDRVTPTHSTPTQRYRPPLPEISSNSQASPSDQRKDLALRRTVSEPILKWKIKKLISSRPNPLHRKISAPPTMKHRTETLDSSTSSSSNPASGCSSPNDSLHSDSGILPLNHERLLLKDGSLAHFTVPPNSTALPNITAGLPAQADLRLARPIAVSGLHQVYLPLEGSSPALAQRLQPVLILEPHTGLVHSQLVSLHGLNSVPLQNQPQSHLSRREGVVSLPSHRPLERTRSEPPPYSHSSLYASHQTHIQPQLSQQYNRVMEGYKQSTPLKKIPSEDMDLEEIGSEFGSGPGSLCGSEPGSVGEEGHRRRQSTTSTDSVYDTESTTSSRESLIEPSHSLNQRQVILRQGHQLDHLGGPAVIWPHQPLFRTRSSPASTSLPPPPHPPTTMPSLSLSGPAADVQLRYTTGLVYDSQMQKHQCTCGDNSRHPEHAGRVQSIWSRLHERGLRSQCERIRSRKATLEELQSVHSEKHVLLFGTNPLNRLKLDSRKLTGILSQRIFVMLPCGGVGVDIDTVWNELHTSAASRIAAGCVTDLALKVAQGELKNGFAVVRPPGHHASHSSPLGFCFFNSVAIAAKQLQHKLNVSKILIVDWDVHHGNGTQEAFYNDPSVLYISLHRFDEGNFFPGSGHPSEVGAGAGEGFNVNVGWTGGLNPPMGDAEYLAAFRAVVMPIAHEFSPDVVLVSAGFDAVEGHSSSLGGYKVTAKCFGFLTRQLMSLAGGRVVLALEGGHDLKAICDASEACVSALLGMEVEPLSQCVLDRKPCENAVKTLQRVIQIQGEYWQSVKDSASTAELSYLQAQRRRLRRDSDSDAVSALASLSMEAVSQDKNPTEK
ncbi:histone deacetylase 7-like isoform X2 [Cheilinus undulatus]|uniref:histone deacetylase 7-like isoform X2 n=1 Tax=Cheilinus undulatus TaxID=241271 RepID=UPI001BD1F8F1|nr:histone deacetylase 7-like isoform X2 [Cheilinus undulatus]